MKLKSIDLCLAFENCGFFRDLLMVGDPEMPNVSFICEDETDEDDKIEITLTGPEFDNFCTAISEALNMLSSIRESQVSADPSKRAPGYCARKTIDGRPLALEHCETCLGCGGLTGEAAHAMRSGKKIQAIKVHRGLNDVGLKESKEFVEDWGRHFEQYQEYLR